MYYFFQSFIIFVWKITSITFEKLANTQFWRLHQTFYNIRLINYIWMFCFYFYAYTLDMFNHMISSVSICFKITLEESIYVEIFSPSLPWSRLFQVGSCLAATRWKTSRCNEELEVIQVVLPGNSDSRVLNP